MTGRLQDKIAIVTGAASGIGRAISLRYASEGAHVIISDMHATSRNPDERERTHSVVQKMGRKSIFVQTDVTDASSVDALVAEAVVEFGRVDIMVNNAGATFEGSTQNRQIWNFDTEVWRKSLDLNCNGVFYGCRAASRQMMEQEPLVEGGDRGWIINTASVMGQVAVANACAYVSSKHLVIGLTKAAALDMAQYKVHVNCICPGYVKSAFASYDDATVEVINKMHPLRGMGEPEDIARIAVFLASDDARWVHGADIVADGGFTCQ